MSEPKIDITPYEILDRGDGWWICLNDEWLRGPLGTYAQARAAAERYVRLTENLPA